MAAPRLSDVVAFAIATAIVFATLGTTSASAQSCGNTATGFPAWLTAYKFRAAAQGIPQATIERALAGVSYDPTTVRLDRSQHSFKLSFEQFYARRVSGAMIARGQRLKATHSGTLSRIEQRFGVPANVVIAIWGLETSYGSDRGGKFSIVRSLATLAYDCRRSKFFENELTSAIRVVQRSDLTPEQMHGGWAGEIGQTQFLPSAYYKYAVDFDGDGRRDLFRSVPDILASTANFLKAHGWKPGQSWGPGTANYAVIKEWNRADVYAQTIAVMAQKLGGQSWIQSSP
jgi:lytic murein transglycosylase